jgi:hypothetical protein
MSRVLRSATVQYSVTRSVAKRPNGSSIAASALLSTPSDRLTAMRYPIRNTTDPT